MLSSLLECLWDRMLAYSLVFFLIGNFLVAMIPTESVLTLGALAAAVASALVWIWRAPQSALLKDEMQSRAIQVSHLQQQIDDGEKALDIAREKLRVCREAVIDAGLRIRELEARIAVKDNT